MRYLIDVVHPAHVHFFKNIVGHLVACGHEYRVVARDKEVTRELLEAFDIPFASVGRSRKGLWRLAAELIVRDASLVRIGREFEADAILTRNPAGTHAAKLLRIPSFFDTDDGTAVGIHFRAAQPFATYITTPSFLPENYGKKHHRYPGFKELAYLHPSHFKPDMSIRSELGIDDRPLIVVRFVGFSASHDVTESGIPSYEKRTVVDELCRYGNVFVSSEEELPPELLDRELNVAPHRMHDVLAAADLCFADSQTVSREAAILGTPTVYVSSFAGKLDVMHALSDEYELLLQFTPEQRHRALETAVAILEDSYMSEPVADVWSARRDRMLVDATDVSEWYTDLVLRLTS